MSDAARSQCWMLAAATAVQLLAGCADPASEDTADPVQPLGLTVEMVVGADPAAAAAYQFTDVLDVLQLEDGSFWVVDGSGGRLVRRYGADGGHLGAVSREGGGPGEYANPRRLVQLQDGRVAVVDPGAAGRLELFTPAGRHSGRLAVADAPPWSDMARAHVGMDGRIFVEVGLRAEAAGAERSWVAVDPVSGRADTIPLLPPPAWAAAPALATGGLPLPYLPGLEATLGADGRPWWVRTDEYRLVAVGPAGALEEGASRTVEAVAVALGERRQLEDAFSGMLAELDPGLSPPAIPSIKPLIRSLDTAADGRLLVHLHGPSRQVDGEWVEDMAWDLFDAGGERFLGRLVLEGDQEILELTGDLVWVLRRDAMGVESLARLRIGR